ncbi:hypothetical protein PFISCL1PPCAC_2738 [Pristionchus fissidentatus]|uniref:Fungal lipase-type domain-containing protein n=1 Tax=Pristionchus fissidentatus TaxID=1538716 RepID=A0AAV5UWK0_9BILA|nr:hypothetical protein PFISCL1PPCAC_2738 [Pristionchus fissidentatus]
MIVRLATLAIILISFVAAQQQFQQVRRTGYDEALAVRMMHLSAAAYGNKHEECIANTFPQSDGRFVFSSTKAECDILDNSCESFIVTSNNVKEAVIVFRGTKTKGQLLLEGWDSYHEGADFVGMGNVNKYFMRAHNHMWPSILEFLAKPEYQHHRIIFTGHSLGGALASLAAARVVKQGIRPASAVLLYTFGQPRTGSYKYAMSFDGLGIPSYRIIYGADIVPHQPPCKKDPRIPANEDGSKACLASDDDEAYHHGTEIWYPQAMTPGSLYLECLGAPKNEDFKCSDMLTFQSNNMDAYFWDHRHYYNLFVTGYGKSGCTNTTVGSAPPKKSRLSKVISSVTNFFGRFG